MRKTRTRVLVSLLTLALAACADPGDDPAELAEPITGYMPNGGFSGLVIVHTGDGRVHTGVLVAADTVVTGSAVTSGRSPSQVTVELAGGIDMSQTTGAMRNVGQILYHPDVDAAYLKLSSAYSGVNLPPLDTRAGSQLVGTSVQGKGYNQSRILIWATMNVGAANDGAQTFDSTGVPGSSIADDDDGIPTVDNSAGTVVGIARSTSGSVHTQIAAKALGFWLPIAQQLFPIAAQSGRFALYNNLATPMCLDIAWGAYGEHAGVNQYPCHYNPNQLWYFDFRSNAQHPMLVSARTGMCLDIPWGPGYALQTYHCQNGVNQQWAQYLHSPQGSGLAYVSSIAAYGAWPISSSMDCLRVQGGPSTSPAATEVRSCQTGTLYNTDQRWFLAWRRRPMRRSHGRAPPAGTAPQSFRSLARGPALASPGGMTSSGQRTLTGKSYERATINGLLARLTAVYPTGLHLSFTLDSQPATLGRVVDERTTRAVADPTVSRRHLTIAADSAARVHVGQDLESRNGAWLDGRPLATSAALTSGAVLRLGNVLLVYERADPSQPLPWLDTPLVSRAAIPGESTGAHLLRAAVARAAPDPSPALIIGETGTGKELIAAEMHRLSGRGGDLVALNCAAISPQLLESHLFGHVRGAFTGAHDASLGLVRAARGGTLFLDEIGELPLELQAKLLRVIQEGEVLPVGSARAAKVDVRVIAATNRDLEADAEAGLFRRDLHARVAMWVVRVPPLRDRRVDILAWVDRLHRRWLERRGRTLPTSGTLAFAADAAEALLLNAWPENLRGVDRLVHELGTSTHPIGSDELPAWLVTRRVTPPVAVPVRPPTPTRVELEAALRETGSVRATAKRYGRDRRQIYRWMEAYGVERERD